MTRIIQSTASDWSGILVDALTSSATTFKISGHPYVLTANKRYGFKIEVGTKVEYIVATYTETDGDGNALFASAIRNIDRKKPLTKSADTYTYVGATGIAFAAKTKISITDYPALGSLIFAVNDILAQGVGGAVGDRQSDWVETDTTAEGFIKNKPDLGTAALLDTGTTEGDIPLLGADGLLSASVIPKDAEVEIAQSDWTETDSEEQAYIQNKPTLGTAALVDTGTGEGDVALLGVGGVFKKSLLPSDLVTEGDRGPKGDKGDTGDTGPAGAAGAAGTDGAKGDKGDKGDTGDTGATGPAGDKGDKGDAGDGGGGGVAPDLTNVVQALGLPTLAQINRNKWIRRRVGDDNGFEFTDEPVGAKGDKGDKGDTGDTGATGPAGAAGTGGGGEENVQVDWNEATVSSDAFIKNKPVIAIRRIPTENPGNNQVWKTDDSGSPSWRDDTEAHDLFNALETKVHDVTVGTAPSGFSEINADVEGGITQGTTRQTNAQLRAATFVRVSTAVSDRYMSVRIPHGSDPHNYRVNLIPLDGGIGFPVPLSSFIVNGVSAGNNPTWDFYTYTHLLGVGVASATLEATASITSFGSSTWIGNLTKGKVYDQAKSIIKAGGSLVATENDDTETIVFTDGVNGERISSLQAATSDLIAGERQVGFADITLDSEGGFYNSVVQPTLDSSGGSGVLATRPWSRTWTPVENHRFMAIRIPAAADPQSYRMHFGNNAGGVPLSQLHRMGEGLGWQYFFIGIADTTPTATLQIDGSADHIGTTTYVGNLDKNKAQSALGIPEFVAANRSKYLQRKGDDTGFDFVDAPEEGNRVVGIVNANGFGNARRGQTRVEYFSFTSVEDNPGPLAYHNGVAYLFENRVFGGAVNIVDLESGKVKATSTVFTESTAAFITAVAFDDENLYISSSFSGLHKVPADFSTTALSASNSLAQERFVAVAFHNGVLYGAETSRDILYTINTDTGALTRVGNSTRFGSNITLRGLTSYNGVLYGIGTSSVQTLYTINTTTGAATRVGSTTNFGVGEANPKGLMSAEGKLYIVGATKKTLYILDPETGIATATRTAGVPKADFAYIVTDFKVQGIAPTYDFTFTGREVGRGDRTDDRSLTDPINQVYEGDLFEYNSVVNRWYRVYTQPKPEVREKEGIAATQLTPQDGDVVDLKPTVNEIALTFSKTSGVNGASAIVRTRRLAGTMYFVGFQNKALYTLNTATSVVTRVGSSTEFGVSEDEPAGLAWHDGKLYMVGDETHNLHTINTTTGVATRVGNSTDFGVSERRPTGLTSHDGKLYMIGTNNDVLYALNTTTGAATRVGSAINFGANLGAPHGLASHNGTLYVMGGSTSTLYSLNVTTGAATSLGTISIDDKNAKNGTTLASSGGVLYSAFVISGNLVLATVNPATRVATRVASLNGFGVSENSSVSLGSSPDVPTTLNIEGREDPYEVGEGRDLLMMHKFEDGWRFINSVRDI